MSIQSMTGFGKSERVAEGYSVHVELKSVNGRFLEVQFKTPRNLMALEPRFKQTLGRFLTRGSITCHIQFESKGSSDHAVAINEPVFKAYRAVFNEIQIRLDTPSVINITDLIKVPDFLTVPLHSEDIEQTTARIMPVFEMACEELVSMRETEGGILERDMRARVEAFGPALEKVKAAIPERQSEYVGKMRSRIQELAGQGTSLPEDRMLAEIGIMAEKLDVTEEIVRFGAHIGLFLDTLSAHKSPGKKLGFILQEMLREVNTLGTKSQYSDIQHICVGLKEELEIVREQIQNIE